MTAWRKPLLLIALAAVLLAAWVLPPDAAATRQVEGGLQRALTSLASARALDAIVSAAQGTEISMQPLGVGVTLAPGQALDPINDLIEQFSGLMLAASVSFGVQRVLLVVGGHWVVSALLSAAVIGWVAWQWRRPVLTDRTGPAAAWVGRLLPRVLFGLLLIRFAVPVAVLGADAGFRWFLADDYAAGQSTLDRTAVQMRELSPPAAAASGPGANAPDRPAPAETGALEQLKRWWSSPASPADGAPAAAGAEPSRLEKLQRLVGDAVEHLVRLIVVFVMQTLVLPLVTWWALAGLLRRLLDR